ncbi:phosphotransferase [Streptomyces fractus]|uniref:phosphotransferase n=1 Tax=Streptomyces fractus TaxID=641806 RepID=UPI003CF8040D
MAGEQDPTTRQELIGRGRTADVYALDGQWVLRRYRDGLDARGEGEVMEYVRAHGFPAPRVRADAGLAPGELVLERFEGPTQLDAMVRGELGPAEAGRELAALLRQLHTVPARPGGRILHLDLHPDNVLRTRRGPVVIDWANAEVGAAGLDWAMSAMILAEVAVDPGRVEAGAAREALGVLLAAPHPRLGEDFLGEVHARRAGNPTLDAREKRRLGAAVELVRALEGGP